MDSFLPVVAVVISISSFVLTYFTSKVQVHERIKGLERDLTAFDANDKQYRKYIQDELTEVNRRTIALESHVSDVPILKMKMDIFWRAIEEHVPGMLMHEYDQERDVLLAKAKSNSLNVEEAKQLKAILTVDLHHMEPNDPGKWAPLLYIVKCDYVISGLNNR